MRLFKFHFGWCFLVILSLTALIVALVVYVDAHGGSINGRRTTTIDPSALDPLPETREERSARITREAREKALAGLPRPIRMEDLLRLPSIDTGEISESISSIFARAATVAVLSLEPTEPTDSITLRAEVKQLQWVKNSGHQGTVSKLILNLGAATDQINFFDDGNRKPWSYMNFKDQQHFVVFSSTAESSWIDQLQDPTQVDALAGTEIASTLQELRFLLEFTSRPVVDQLKLLGLMDYFRKGGKLGKYLADHLGNLYSAHSPSVRPKMLPIVDELGSQTIGSPSAAGSLIFYLTLRSDCDTDCLGAAILMLLKGMNAFNAINGEGIVEHGLVGSCDRLRKLFQPNKEIVSELMQRKMFVDQTKELRRSTRDWVIRTQTDEQVLIAFTSMLEELEGLK